MKIGIIGDYNPTKRSHAATMAALQHAARGLGIELEVHWLPTESLLAPDTGDRLRMFAGLWAAPGSPYRSGEGAHEGIRFAREQDWPFIGT